MRFERGSEPGTWAAGARAGGAESEPAALERQSLESALKRLALKEIELTEPGNRTQGRAAGLETAGSDGASAALARPVPDAIASVAATGAPSLVGRLTPRASARVQLVLASIVWLIGASILGVRGVIYLSRSHWAAWLVALALVVGVVKGHLVIKGVARRAVARIRVRGRKACLFGFFSWKSWLLIALMMGGGIMLRRSGAPSAFLGVLYVAVATALLYGDHTYWLAAIAPQERD